MRTARVQRQSYLDLRRVTIGDWVVLVAALFSVVSLFLPWFVAGTPRQHNEWAFTYSQVASLLVIVFFLVTIFLVLYPAVAAELGLAPLSFSPPVLFFFMGALLVLVFTYQLGKYACVECTESSRGYGIWIGLVASVVYLLGAIIRWGSRPARRA